MATASAATLSTVDKGDGPSFGMQKGSRIQQGQILYQGKYIDQSQFYRVSTLWILSSLAIYLKSQKDPAPPKTSIFNFTSICLSNERTTNMPILSKKCILKFLHNNKGIMMVFSCRRWIFFWMWWMNEVFYGQAKIFFLLKMHQIVSVCFPSKKRTNQS